MNNKTYIAKSFISKRDYLAQKGHPAGCHWNITLRCNANCHYCYAKSDSFGEVDTKTALNIVDKIADAGVTSIVLSGGEPFLRTDIIEILNHIFKRNFFKTSILTNGTLITNDQLDFLVKHAKYFSTIQMSAFSHIDKINDEYLGVDGALEKILFVAKKLINAGITVPIAINPMQFNLSHLRETYDFFKSKNLIPRISGKKLQTDINRNVFDADLYSYEFHRKFLNAIPNDTLDFFMTKMKNCLNRNHKRSTNLCTSLQQWVAIDPNGNVAQCQLLLNDPIGNITEWDSLTELLLKSEKYNYIKNLKATDLGRCQDCRFLNFCTLCVGERFIDNKNLFAPRKQTCDFALAVYDHYNEIYAKNDLQ